MRAHRYEITVTGEAGPVLYSEFGDCQVTVGAGVITLRAELPDQAALPGLIQRITGSRLELTKMLLVPVPGAAAGSAGCLGAFPVRWSGLQAVVTFPEHVDVSNAGQIRDELLSAINRGARALIADMTATASCDHAGADAVVRAYQRAAASGTQLRLVVTAQIVRRVLSITGLDRLISIYPSLEAATIAGGAG